MENFIRLFKNHKPLIAMIHLDALPGTPAGTLKPHEIIPKALDEARIYADNGISSVLIENMHDRPYLKSKVGHEISCIMAIIGHEIKQKTGLICGIQILAGANSEALAAAHAAGLDFIRAEGYVFGHLADEGYIESGAAELMRYRKQIGAENILIFTDVKKKHSSHAITADMPAEDQAHAAEFFLSDGIILTGKFTGLEPDINEITMVKAAVKLPLILGSGITDHNIGNYYQSADGFIIGSFFKQGGNWQNPPDNKRIQSLLNSVNAIHSGLK